MSRLAAGCRWSISGISQGNYRTCAEASERSHSQRSAERNIEAAGNVRNGFVPTRRGIASLFAEVEFFPSKVAGIRSLGRSALFSSGGCSFGCDCSIRCRYTWAAAQRPRWVIINSVANLVFQLVARTQWVQQGLCIAVSLTLHVIFSWRLINVFWWRLSIVLVVSSMKLGVVRFQLAYRKVRHTLQPRSTWWTVTTDRRILLIK